MYFTKIIAPTVNVNNRHRIFVVSNRRKTFKANFNRFATIWIAVSISYHLPEPIFPNNAKIINPINTIIKIPNGSVIILVKQTIIATIKSTIKANFKKRIKQNATNKIKPSNPSPSKNPTGSPPCFKMIIYLYILFVNHFKNKKGVLSKYFLKIILKEHPFLFNKLFSFFQKIFCKKQFSNKMNGNRERDFF